MKHAVLGLVAREPAHGYALVAVMGRWPLPEELRPGRSTVYRHLASLSAAGHIAPSAADPGVAASRHPDRTIYAATDTGLAAFDRYARTVPATFDDLCLRMAVARPEDLPLLADHAAQLERASLQLFQEWTLMGDPCRLMDEGAPWRSVMRSLVARRRRPTLRAPRPSSAICARI